MVVTLSLKDIILFILFICLIVMVIFATVLIAKIIPTVKQLNEVLKDTKEITEVAKKRVNDVDGIVDDVSISMGGVAKALKGEENLMQSLSSVSKAVTSLVGLMKKES